MRLCSVADCGRGGKLTRGMCVRCYRYWLDHTPQDRRPTAPRFARSFWDFVDKTSSPRGCWLWTGAINAGGYGWWSGEGRRGLAHRLALAEETSPPDPRRQACHRCDNPPCVNPAHLYWGTQEDNSRDMRQRGRPANGNSRKTHCKRGHPLAGRNLLIVGSARARQCRTCCNKRGRLHMAAKRRDCV